MNFASMHFEVIRLSKRDVAVAQELFRLFREVFEVEETTPPGKEYLSSLLARTDLVVLCIRYEGNVVGGLTAYELPMYQFEGSEMFIYDIAIKQEFQRRGLGKKLLRQLEVYCRSKGIRQVFVDASAEDIHAVDFYRTSGGEGEEVVQFTFGV
ncbi:hypothetical protein C900_05561 [Fulvivirga imtechensis AK7]|uniref:N-acetyltransferase domain-containing protein n=1 Tax=Fulvivirga imtechensis AK7 TaxID=1237149 RepID=L8JL86_9BACT|nr:GNAT family N-acetyltransferase [Fulvivirga imtechensis]ELR69003.1 hypothetical protein C900_05561 [Fulvivirga imtechensis AK7]